MSAMRKTEERFHAPAPVEARRDEDWLWMVAEDPAFYLEESDGAR
jgi:hypothetical protein